MRVQHVDTNTHIGVPQGGSLSPFLFNLYVDDLIHQLNDNSDLVLAFADDIAVATSSRTQLTRVIKCLENWSSINGIRINKAKSAILEIKCD
jgi:hypothetical protein